jgi:hypothetical protein
MLCFVILPLHFPAFVPKKRFLRSFQLESKEGYYYLTHEGILVREHTG